MLVPAAPKVGPPVDNFKTSRDSRSPNKPTLTATATVGTYVFLKYLAARPRLFGACLGQVVVHYAGRHVVKGPCLEGCGRSSSRVSTKKRNDIKVITVLYSRYYNIQVGILNLRWGSHCNILSRPPGREKLLEICLSLSVSLQPNDQRRLPKFLRGSRCLPFPLPFPRPPLPAALPTAALPLRPSAFLA